MRFQNAWDEKIAGPPASSLRNPCILICLLLPRQSQYSLCRPHVEQSGHPPQRLQGFQSPKRNQESHEPLSDSAANRQNSAQSFAPPRPATIEPLSVRSLTSLASAPTLRRPNITIHGTIWPSTLQLLISYMPAYEVSEIFIHDYNKLSNITLTEVNACVTVETPPLSSKLGMHGDFSTAFRLH